MDEPIEPQAEPTTTGPTVTTIKQVSLWAWANNTDQSAMLVSRSDEPGGVRLIIEALKIDAKLDPAELRTALDLITQ